VRREIGVNGRTTERQRTQKHNASVTDTSMAEAYKHF